MNYKATEKRRLTMEKKREGERRRKAEREQTINVLREIRDNSGASPADRLRAVEMLSELSNTDYF